MAYELEIKSLESWINLLWRLRINRDLVTFDHKFKTFKELATTPEWKLEADLLEVASLRGKGDVEASQNLAFALRGNPNLRDPLRSSLQIGLNHLMLNQDVEAWPYFMECADKVCDLNSKLMSLGNLVICLNNLGLGHVEKLTHLEELTKIETEKNNPIAKAIGAQNLAIRLKDDFRSGNWDQFFNRFNESENPHGQAVYLAAWASRLPYAHSDLKKDFSWIQSALMGQMNLFRQQSRLNTILAIKDQDESLKLHERIDRLYLWTWLHLTDPQSLPLHWLLNEIEMIQKEDYQTASYEDYQMLRNVLGWLQLLDGREIIDWAIHFNFKFRIGSRVDAVLVNEWSLIQEWREHFFKEGKLSRKDEHGDFYLSLEGTEFFTRMNKIVKSAKLPAFGVEVYAEKGLIASVEKMTIDFQLARFLAAITGESHLSFFKIAQDVLGAHTYEPQLHDGQIIRLIQKAKSYISERDSISVRGEAVLRSRPISDVTIVVNPWKNPSDFKIWQDLIKKINQTHVSKVEAIPDWINAILGKESIYRQELQDLMSWSKAKTNRMISEALLNGWLERVGSGASVHYKVVLDEKGNAL